MDIIIDKEIGKEFEEIYNLCKNYTMTSRERMLALYNSIKNIIDDDIPGDFVETGVWKGGSSMLVAKYFELHNISDRKIYMYDTYTGMSKPTEYDVTTGSRVSSVTKWDDKKQIYKTKKFDVPLDVVKKNMGLTGLNESNIIYVKGKVEDTIPSQTPKNICLLRLDTDWYESTKHSLEHLFPILSINGILIIDDYGHMDGAKKASDDYFKDVNDLKLQEIDYTGRLLVKTFEL